MLAFYIKWVRLTGLTAVALLTAAVALVATVITVVEEVWTEKVAAVLLMHNTIYFGGFRCKYDTVHA